jgi:DNA-binding transcriptional regulator/RsmH inhibitor MraZ
MCIRCWDKLARALNNAGPEEYERLRTAADAVDRVLKRQRQFKMILGGKAQKPNSDKSYPLKREFNR